MKTTRRTGLQSLTTLLAVVAMLSFGFSAVSVAYAAGRHSHASVVEEGRREVVHFPADTLADPRDETPAPTPG
ncbi:MAG: hypothetical protein H0V07_00140 [Propionibacteriales bacterium]|nr:hypothetical protein [Propionibacteriales bacterium]